MPTRGSKARSAVEKTPRSHAGCYDRRMDAMVQKVYPFVKEVYEKQGNMYQNIAFLSLTAGRFFNSAWT